MSIDNSNGAIRAVAFGKGYDASQFDPAVDGPGRQAGSSFKSITLATALSEGYSPEDRVSGAARCSWRLGPGNSDPFYNLSGDCHGGTPTLTEAIAKSDNCAFVRTELSLGPGNYGQDGVRRVIAMASRMGINTSQLLEPYVSTTLGTNGVHPLEMAQAYSVIAADGVLHPAQFVSKIVGPNGKVLYQAPTTGTPVLTPQVARSETQMLTEVLEATEPRRAPQHRPAGRGQDGHHRPATPTRGSSATRREITAAVWMGDPNGETPMTNVGGIAVFGATYPAHIWASFMKATHSTRSRPARLPSLPDEKLWPKSQYIDDKTGGARAAYYSSNYSNTYSPTTTTSPVVAPPTTIPTSVSPTTAAAGYGPAHDAAPTTVTTPTTPPTVPTPTTPPTGPDA